MKLKSSLTLLLLSLVTLHQLEFGIGSRVLAAFFFPGKSHFMMTNAIIRELVKRGHEVTFITPFSLEKENLGKNYTQILIPQYNFWPSILQVIEAKSIFDMTDISALTYIKVANIMGLDNTNFAFEQPEILKLIHAKDKVGKYDLLLVEQFFHEGALYLGHLYEVPVITVSTFGISNYLSPVVGHISPWSYAPHYGKSYSEHMTLTERFDNVFLLVRESLMRTFWYYPEQDAILRKHFSKHFDNLPTIKQLERNISAILINSYMPLEAPKPLSFNMVPVGGLHIQPPQPLPAKIQKFLNEAEHGFIYFSLGSQVRSADMPPEKLEVFLNVFRGLKQRVLWKFEDDRLSNMSANVMVEKWMPQNDILAHPNIKIFISHGGLFGTQEAVHYGVPVLGMPVFADQSLNIKKGAAAGYALGVDYRTVTEEQLRYSLTELLENPKYLNNVKRASKIFKDRPMSAMDTTMFWINYVIEHRGAPHMVSAGLDLTWYQFYLLDILAIALGVLLFSLLGLCYFYRQIFTTKTLKNKPKKN